MTTAGPDLPSPPLAGRLASSRDGKREINQARHQSAEAPDPGLHRAGKHDAVDELSIEPTTAHSNLTFVYPAVPSSVRRAREDARRVGASAGISETRGDDLVLLVSELVTNVVRHSDAADVFIGFRLDDMLRVRVEDHTQGVPSLDAARPVGGWGLQLVGMLSTAWGVIPTVEGKAVWFDLPLGDELPN